jgi:hypothetical protein
VQKLTQCLWAVLKELGLLLFQAPLIYHDLSRLALDSKKWINIPFKCLSPVEIDCPLY